MRAYDELRRYPSSKSWKELQECNASWKIGLRARSRQGGGKPARTFVILAGERRITRGRRWRGRHKHLHARRLLRGGPAASGDALPRIREGAHGLPIVPDPQRPLQANADRASLLQQQNPGDDGGAGPDPAVRRGPAREADLTGNPRGGLAHERTPSPPRPRAQDLRESLLSFGPPFRLAHAACAGGLTPPVLDVLGGGP